MVEFVCVIRVNGKVYGVNDSGVRIVRRKKSVDEVREFVKGCIDDGYLVEFIGCGWRCVCENGRYWWSKIRELECYVDDVDVYWCE